MGEQSSSVQAPWIPQTPMKPIAPIYHPGTTEQQQSNPDQTEQRRFFGNNDMDGLDHLSFGDLLALANTASVYFSGQGRWATGDASAGIDQSNVVCGEMLRKGNEATESMSSVSNNVAEQIKTPEKPKRRKHRPKVVKEAKPKRVPKPKTPRKPAAESQESKTPKRKYVRKKKEINNDQESTPVQESAAVEASAHAKRRCRRALDFEDESFKPENGEKAGEYLIPAPSTPKRNRSRQVKRKGNEPKENVDNQEEVDISMAQAAKRRQVQEPLCDYEKTRWLFFENCQQEGMRFDAICSTTFLAQQQCKGTFQGMQSFESSFSLDSIDKPMKKKTKGHARYRNLSSIIEVTEVSEPLQAGRDSRPQNKNDVLVETQLTLSKKKQTTKSRKIQTNQITVLSNHSQFPALSAGLSTGEIWNRFYSVDAISEKLGVLDINKENSETALVPYLMQGPGNQMILFTGGAGEIVPATPVKKRRPRAKVDLDDETDKMWNLLMENINSEGVDGSDKKKAKWWEEERNVFRGRADSFIARMHLVQGDRRFTPWKGSVVDSVVGVFLTQNVSDHLSSSAFMSLAAAFPAPSVPSTSFDVGTSSMPSIRITYLDSEESMSNPPVHNQISVTVHNTQPDEEKDYVNSDDTSRTSSEITSSSHESAGKTTDLNADMDSDRIGSSIEVEKTDQTTYLVQHFFPSEDSALTCQNSLVSDAPHNTKRAGSCSEINSQVEHYTSYVKLIQSLGKGRDSITADTVSVEESNQKNQYGQEVGVSSNPGGMQVSPNTSPCDCSSEVKDFKSLKGHTKSSDDSNEPFCCSGDVLYCQKPEVPESSSSVPSIKLVTETSFPDINESTSCLDTEEPSGPEATLNAKGKKVKKVSKEEKEGFDWDVLRREAHGRAGKREKTSRTMDSVDWEAIRRADVSEVSETIKSRGMNHVLAERIQGFLNRLVTDHGSIDLEWLRDVPPDKAKEYLLSFRGLGLKSVECVRLLTLHHLAFPVDTNVGRIAVRLGWVPLQPLPESLQLHLLEMYPVLESIQKYLWPRLCKLDQKTLYELHYQMITFGKVFCTKSKPNCNACPMRGECRHFASAFASARLALPGTKEGMGTPDKNPLPLHLPEPLQRQQGLEVVQHLESANRVACCEPIIEEPASPEPECSEVSLADIEDAFYEDPEEIPTIRLNMDAFTNNLKKIMEHNTDDGNMSNALVALTAEAASIPMPKLKNISQLRTEHQVYELPDSHPLLAKLEKREPDDPCSYLLAIWTPGETVDSVEPAVSKCISREAGRLCDEETCFSCNSIKEARSQTVRGTILIPCRTAMNGSFPLNGTYFQVNEVFADHDSSLTPIDVPREWLWDLSRRTVYFGTSIPSIFKGLSTETIQQCFWRGYVCVRGFDRKTRGPKPLIARLHFPASKAKSQANPPPNPGAA